MIPLPAQALTRHPIPVAIEPGVAALLQLKARLGARSHLAAILPRRAAVAGAAGTSPVGAASGKARARPAEAAAGARPRLPLLAPGLAPLPRRHPLALRHRDRSILAGLFLLREHAPITAVLSGNPSRTLPSSDNDV